MSKQKRPNLTLLTSTANSRTIEKETRIEISRFAAKQIEKLPYFILKSIQDWQNTIEEDGLAMTRKIPGYHDEPLKGNRLGQRSIKLNRSWRLIYEEHEFENETWITITVVEVNKHAY